MRATVARRPEAAEHDRPCSAAPRGSSHSADEERLVRRNFDTTGHFVADLYQRKFDTLGTTKKNTYRRLSSTYGLEAAVHAALQAAGLRQEIVAVFLAPLGPTSPSWSPRISDRGPIEAVEGLVIDTRGREVFLRGQAVPLTAREFALLRYLYERRGAVITREELLRDVWGESYGCGARTVDVHIRRLRGKLGADWFETARGIGYKFRRRR